MTFNTFFKENICAICDFNFKTVVGNYTKKLLIVCVIIYVPMSLIMVCINSNGLCAHKNTIYILIPVQSVQKWK